jgi:glycine/D-amino acid oxidase-like deaminating enzyme
MTALSGLTTRDGIGGDLSLECGVVVVGSGAGGATVAAELAEAGVDVIVLEEGGYHPTASFTAGTGRALRTLYRDGGGGMAIGRPSVLYAEGRCVGGSTVVNGGMSWRTPARVRGPAGHRRAGPRPLLRRDRVPALGRPAGPGDDRAGLRAVPGRRAG